MGYCERASPAGVGGDAALTPCFPTTTDTVTIRISIIALAALRGESVGGRVEGKSGVRALDDARSILIRRREFGGAKTGADKGGVQWRRCTRRVDVSDGGERRGRDRDEDAGKG